MLAAARDTSRPIEERESALIELSLRKDAAALNALKAVGDARVYLNFVAVEAIGNFRRSSEQSSAAAYLQSKLKDSDAQVAGAAIRAYAQLSSEASVSELADSLQANRVRPDGHQETVCTAAVLALRDIASPAAVPALLSELQRVDEKGWSLEYGSRVLEALKPIATPDGRSAAAAYASRLAARIPADKLARAYYEEKIAEAQKVSGR